MKDPNQPVLDGLESSALLGAILASIQDGVFLVDPGLHITFWNNGAARITGYLRQEAVGRHCEDELLEQRTAEGAAPYGEACPLRETLRDGSAREAFGFLRHKSGHRVPVRLRVTAVRNREGAVVGAAEVFEEWSFRQADSRQVHILESLHLVDPLTGLMNREMIAARLCERVGELSGFGIPFGILLVDVDRLEQMNRRFGRDAGDAILRMVAHTLAKGVASERLLGRWEEDQFLAIVDDCDRKMLEDVAERLRAMVAGSSIQWWGETVRATVSIGGVTASPRDSQEGIIDRATRVLAECRQGGDVCRVE